MDRPYLAAEPLQCEHGGGVADVSIGDMGLDGDEIHFTSWIAGSKAGSHLRHSGQYPCVVTKGSP
jgi:hypothetical protein